VRHETYPQARLTLSAATRETPVAGAPRSRASRCIGEEPVAMLEIRGKRSGAASGTGCQCGDGLSSPGEVQCRDCRSPVVGQFCSLYASSLLDRRLHHCARVVRPCVGMTRVRNASLIPGGHTLASVGIVTGSRRALRNTLSLA
jgi:hypothetical protein